jgi:hypothetical protein
VLTRDGHLHYSATPESEPLGSIRVDHITAVKFGRIYDIPAVLIQTPRRTYYCKGFEEYETRV